MAENDYNKRLFNKSTLRGKIHSARFSWMEQSIKQYCPNFKSVLELGCFDGKSILALPNQAEIYEGWDANWEGGLDLAKQNWKGHNGLTFHECETYEAFKPTQASYDVTLCMETLEHLPIYNYEEYIKTLAKHTSGYLFVTIPNEKKIPFTIKYLIKSTLLRKQKLDQYSASEVWNATLGRLEKVKRINTSHKGFDYEEMIKVLSNYFDIKKIEGIPYKLLGPKLSFTVGIICKARS